MSISKMYGLTGVLLGSLAALNFDFDWGFDSLARFGAVLTGLCFLISICLYGEKPNA